MKYPKMLLLLLVLFAGCELHDVELFPPPEPEVPVANVPPEARQRNWASKLPSKYGQGSCVHASTINALRWHGEFTLATYWSKKYSGGETSVSISKIWAKEGIPYVSTLNEQTYECSGDPRFLEWVSDTRRSCVIWFKEAHACTFVGFSEQDGKRVAGVLDNNYPEKIEFYEANDFIKRWRGHGGFAIAPISPKSPPTLPIPWPVVVPKQHPQTSGLWK
jgi:hypothetical protein